MVCSAASEAESTNMGYTVSWYLGEGHLLVDAKNNYGSWDLYGRMNNYCIVDSYGRAEMGRDDRIQDRLCEEFSSPSK